eukprot:TRINITY_DN31_c0_g1_i23.p1 TRINITY_DN31_c0_g1~~TRINITY_DN31_c0_g1_i23.p1  ORF type:complete len:466 (-),score=94.98 TRINITY_DN31_c0_g1_i23:198-1595(-)
MKRTRYSRKASAFCVMTPTIPASLLAANKPSHQLRIRAFTALSRDAAAGVHVVVKNAACVAVLESSDARFSFRRATVTAALWYDCQPPKPVDYVVQAPMEYSVTVVQPAQPGGSETARVECRLKVLTSQHEGQHFRIRFTVFDTNTAIVEATTEPIRVISKAEKKGAASRRRTAPSKATPATPATPSTINQTPFIQPTPLTQTAPTPLQYCGKRAYDLSPESSPSPNSSCSDDPDAPAVKYQCAEIPVGSSTPPQFATPSPVATPATASSTPSLAPQPSSPSPLFTADTIAQHALITLAQLVETCPATERDAFLGRAVQGAVALAGSPAALAPLFAEIASALTSVASPSQQPLLPSASSVFCSGGHCSIPDCSLPSAAEDPSMTPFLNVREVPSGFATAEPPTLPLPPPFAADAYSSDCCFATDYSAFSASACVSASEVVDCLATPDSRSDGSTSLELAAPEDFW